MVKRLILALIVLVVMLLSGCRSIQRTAFILDNRYYLPIIAHQRLALVGVEWESSASTAAQYYVSPSPIRVSCRWSEAEAERGVYDWSICDDKVGDFRPFILTLKMSPEWARNFWEPQCKLPQQEYWADFAAFAKAAQARYLPIYVEIWNEPDARLEDMEPSWTRHFGCLGPDNGAYYGEFVQYISDNTDFMIAAGAVSSIDNGFLNDFLATTNDFEMLTFHCYARNIGGVLWNPCVDIVEQAALKFPRTLLDETAVVNCYGFDNHEALQVDYFKWLETIQVRWIWYTLLNNGWCETDLIGKDGPRPVYQHYVEYYR